MKLPDPTAPLYWHSCGSVMRRAFAEPVKGAAIGSLICAERMDVAEAEEMRAAAGSMPGPAAYRIWNDLDDAIEGAKRWLRCLDRVAA